MATAAGGKAGSTSGESAQVELILAQIDALPTLSPVAVQLLQLALDDRTRARDLARLIESDPSLSSRILAMVRRADRSVETDSIERAVVMLGFDAIRNLALAIEIFETFSHRTEKGSEHFDRLGFWKHALATGCAAQLLASTKTGAAALVRPEEAFLCGLLHDLGKIALAAGFPRTYDRIVQKADMSLLAIADVERQVFGLDHTVAGRRLAAHWKLPTMIEECVWLHHQPAGALPSQLNYPDHIRLVRMADDWVRHLRIGYSGNHRPGPSPAELLGDTADAEAQADVLTGRLFELIERRAEWLGLDAVSTQEMFEEALSRANAQLAQVNASLTETNQKLQQRVECFEALRVFKSALAEDPSHESVCRAAAEAVRAILPDESTAVIALSPARQVAVMVSSSSKGPEPFRVERLPIEKVGGLTDRTHQRAGWTGADLLAGGARDRLAAMMDGPPLYWRPIECQGRTVGAIVVSAAISVDDSHALSVLADWAGSWLNGAETRALADRLSEEMTEMNRRLTESQAETTRMRSLAMVGETAAGAAHELNNPLAVISGRAQILMADASDDAIRRAAEVIAEHAHKASAIVTELMEFAKPAPPQPGPCSMARLLGEARRDWLTKAGLSTNQFILTISDDVPDVCADASQIGKLFDEVFRNAVEATAGKTDRRLNVNCWFEVADERVVVRVEDNGVGMTADVLERAMDPFFSHRPAGRGRGLGLSRAARYAEINGGRIRLASRPDEGTVVLVSLPAISRT